LKTGSLRNQLYYGVKPLLPAVMRRGIRGWFTRRKRENVGHVWPILPGSDARPPDWRGWPHGKKFAVVLTHDVEEQGGVDQCRQLMETEMRHGFRSSFNFVPEGNYKVSKELRDELTRNGFEVGIHDLQHDGKLYSDRQAFAQKARRINTYLKDWNAVGFRSGFMLHNLDWLHDLDIAYDASTFDTDPFEPQPDCAGTIFPFWKEAPDGRGYVELPYTLPQDSTLFLLLGEKSPDVWLKKIDWIAERGGMVMLIVHPDYLDFGRNGTKTAAIPIRHYETMLKHLREKHGDTFWQPLARDLAGWYRNQRIPGSADGSRSEAKPLRKKRAAVILYSYYATDPRPRRETEALARAGMEVDVLCLRKDADLAAYEKIDGVNVHRAPLRRRRAGKMTYVVQYGTFFYHALVFLTRRSFSRRYDLVHVHNMPDFLVFSAIVPRLLGAKVILDLHDPMPELLGGIYGYTQGDFAVKLLTMIERLSIAFSDLTITPNIAFKDVFASRSSCADKIEIVMNSPSRTHFDEKKYPARPVASGAGSPFVIMYHGLLVERHGLDLAIHAMARLRDRLPGLQLHFYGEETEYAIAMVALIKELGVENSVKYHGYKSQKEIAEIISTIDLGIIPNRRNPFTEINFPTRIFEYLTMGKPVLAPRTKGISDYFSDGQIVFFEPENIDDLTAKIEWACRCPAELQAVLQAGRVICDQHAWATEEKHFIGCVSKLLAPPA
jgi:glycosyltransferase involved in cell wall biosynthesis